MMISVHSSMRHHPECTAKINWRAEGIGLDVECGSCVALLLGFNNNLAFHAFVPKAAGMATLERVRSWRLGKEFDQGRFPFLELPAFFVRSED
jgi:hypothetical protein